MIIFETIAGISILIGVAFASITLQKSLSHECSFIYQAMSNTTKLLHQDNIKTIQTSDHSFHSVLTRKQKSRYVSTSPTKAGKLSIQLNGIISNEK